MHTSNDNIFKVQTYDVWGSLNGWYYRLNTGLARTVENPIPETLARSILSEGGFTDSDPEIPRDVGGFIFLR